MDPIGGLDVYGDLHFGLHPGGESGNLCGQGCARIVTQGDGGGTAGLGFLCGGEEEFLAEQGFVPDGEGWTLDCGDYALIVTADDGFSAAEMRAVSGESELLRLPYAKYSPIEVSA